MVNMHINWGGHHLKNVPQCFSVVFLLVTLAGCVYLPKASTYSKKEIEQVRTDATFNRNVEKILSALKEALLDMGFEIAKEDTNSIITFPFILEKADFGEYAVQEVKGGYEPISESELYEPPSVKLLCSITPEVMTSPVGRKTNVRVIALFEAYRKEKLYREPHEKTLKSGYQEFKGEEIKCVTTGKLEKELFAFISEFSGVRRQWKKSD